MLPTHKDRRPDGCAQKRDLVTPALYHRAGGVGVEEFPIFVNVKNLS